VKSVSFKLLRCYRVVYKCFKFKDLYKVKIHRDRSLINMTKIVCQEMWARFCKQSWYFGQNVQPISLRTLVSKYSDRQTKTQSQAFWYNRTVKQNCCWISNQVQIQLPKSRFRDRPQLKSQWPGSLGWLDYKSMGKWKRSFPWSTSSGLRRKWIAFLFSGLFRSSRGNPIK